MIYYTNYLSKFVETENNKIKKIPTIFDKRCCLITPFLLPSSDNNYVKTIINRLIELITTNVDDKESRSEILVLLSEDKFIKYKDYIVYSVLLFTLVNIPYIPSVRNFPNLINVLIKYGLLNLEDVKNSIANTIDSLNNIANDEELFNSELNKIILDALIEIDTVGTMLSNNKAIITENKSNKRIEFDIYLNDVIYHKEFTDRLIKLFIYSLHTLPEIVHRYDKIINDKNIGNLFNYNFILSHMIDVSFNKPIIRNN